MSEIRKNQIVSLLSKLNDMSLADFGHVYADFVFKGDRLFIDASSRSARIALEMLLGGFPKMTVFGDGCCMLEIWFHKS